jgi:hypothetical protein
LAASVGRLAFSKPHCEVCPLFLGQTVPVVQTKRGLALFCEVCALGHGYATLSVGGRAGSLEVTVDDAGDASTEEE